MGNHHGKHHHHGGGGNGGNGGGGNGGNGAGKCTLKGVKLTNLGPLAPFIECELNKYGGKGATYVQKVLQEALGLGNQLLGSAQGFVSNDIGRIEQDVQQIEHFLRAFIQTAMNAVDEDLQKVEQWADQFLQSGLKKLSSFIQEETQSLLHSLAPLLAWIVVILLIFQLYGGIFQTLPVAYRVAIAATIVIAIPPHWREKIDVAASPTALILFIVVLTTAASKK
jgi:Fe2+ transport system protein B